MEISLTKQQAQLVAYTIGRLYNQTSGYSQGYQVQDSCKAIINKLPKNIQEWDEDQEFADKIYWATR